MYAFTARVWTALYDIYQFINSTLMEAVYKKVRYWNLLVALTCEIVYWLENTSPLGVFL